MDHILQPSWNGANWKANEGGIALKRQANVSDKNAQPHVLYTLRNTHNLDY